MVRDDQRQLPVDDHHEDRGCGDVHDRPGGIHDAPGQQVRDATRIRGDACDQASDSVLCVVRKREVLQVIEEHLAQVVLDALAQHTGQVNEREHKPGLEQLEHAIDDGNAHQRGLIFQRDALVHDLLVQVREVGIQHGCQHDGDEKAHDPFPMRLEQADNAFEHRSWSAVRYVLLLRVR